MIGCRFEDVFDLRNVMYWYFVYLFVILLFLVCLWLVGIWFVWYWGVGISVVVVGLGIWDFL